MIYRGRFRAAVFRSRDLDCRRLADSRRRGAAVACRCDRETLAVLGGWGRDHAGGRSGAAFFVP